MSEILSQDEIEALLSSLASETPDQEPINPNFGSIVKKSTNLSSTVESRMKQKSHVSYELYDFRRPDKFSKDQLRTLQFLNETFARLAGSALSSALRTPVSIDLISLEQVPYEEYLRSITHSVFTIMAVPPLSGQAVLEMEFNLVFSIIDKMLGGPGKGINRNVLTEIERPLIRSIIERLFNCLKSAWEGVVVVNPVIDGMETSAQFVQIAPPNDIVITILFEVKLGTSRYAMSLCIPYLLLKPVTAKMSAQRWFVSSNRRHSAANRMAVTHQVVRSKVDCSVHLGNAKLLLRDFLDIQPGDVLKLDQKTKDNLRFSVESIPKYYGKPALQGKQIVFSVTDQIEL